jgi:Protein of unknown function (DUF2958)
MKLLTKAILKRLPLLGSSENKELGEIVAQVKFFFPDFSWTWYAAEWDGEDMFWGLVAGDDVELGTFSLAELTSTRGKLGLPIERDKWFKPTPLRELMERHGAQVTN